MEMSDGRIRGSATGGLSSAWEAVQTGHQVPGCGLSWTSEGLMRSPVARVRSVQIGRMTVRSSSLSAGWEVHQLEPAAARVDPCGSACLERSRVLRARPVPGDAESDPSEGI